MIYPPRFPKRLTIELEDFHRESLDEIAHRIPHDDAQDLIKVVISRGVIAILTEDSEASVSVERTADNLAAAKERFRSLQFIEGSGIARLEAKYATRPFPAPSVLFKRRKEQAERAASDLAFAKSRAPTDDTDSEPALAAPREVENYVGVPLTPEMQEDLETFLEGHPEADVEIACMTLLQLGLSMVEIDLQEVRRAKVEKEIEADSSRSQQAEERVRLAETLYLRAKKRCF
jgi:hypothetical protein